MGKDAKIADAIKGVLAVGDKWGLEMSRYGKGRTRESATCPGHVLQIFVHSSIVDSVAYGSVPLGRLAPGGVPISTWLAQQCPLDGQARLLMYPDVFFDMSHGLVRVFTHSGSPIYGHVQRQRLLGDLDALIAPLFESTEDFRRAHAFLANHNENGEDGSRPNSVQAVFRDVETPC